jgi:tetratricopeptide (TPR) repeat protein
MTLPPLVPPPRSRYVQDLMLAAEQQLAEGAYEIARPLLETMAAAAPDDPGVLCTMGAVFEIAKQYDDALKLLLQAVARNPAHSPAWSNIGMITARGVLPSDAHTLAHAAHVLAAQSNPRAIYPAWSAAQSALALGDRPSADRWIADVNRRVQAHSDDPSNRGATAEFNRAFMHLALGSIDPAHYPVGFRCYERRLETHAHNAASRTAGRVPPGVPRWTIGQAAPPRLAVFAEQGLGDLLMCLRYVLALIDAGHHVQLETPPALAPLLADRLADRIAASDGRLVLLPFDAPLVADVDAYVWAMSLPGLCWQGPAAIPPGALLPRRWRRARPYVAFCWQGSRAHASDRVRSCPPETFAPLAAQVRAAGFTPIALNHGEPVPDALDAPPIAITTLADTATVLDQCAAVVSIDSALVHLAGSMDVPTYACVATPPDWRWGLQGDPPPWYARVTVVRQPTAGDWASVVAEIATLLPEVLSA